MMGYSTKSCRFAPSRTTYVSVGNYHGFERTASFSVSVWAKWTATGLSFTMVGKMGDSPTFRGWSLRAITTGEIHAYLINDHATLNEISVQTVSTAFKDGKWHHIVMTYDGSSTAAGVKIYVDHNLQAVTVNANALSATIVSTDELRLGARVTTGNETYFDGNLDEIAIYDKTLSAAEVTAIWNWGTTNDLSLLGSAANLVGWWRMGDGDTYPTLTDYGSGAHNGTMTNMLAGDIRTDAPPTAVVTNYSTKSCRFDTTRVTYVSVGDHYAFERTDVFSASCWVKWSNTGLYVMVGKMGDSTAFRGWMLRSNTTGEIQAWLINDNSTNNKIQVQTNSAYNNGAWHHVVMTYDGSSTAAGVKIYVDGALAASTSVVDALSATIVSTDEFRIGGRKSTGAEQCFQGTIDEVSIYSKVLSAGDVAALYDDGGTCDLTTLVGSDPNLIGWWRMGDGDTYPTLTDHSTSGYNGTMTNMSLADIQSDAPFPRFMVLDHTNWRFKNNIPLPYSRRCLAFTGSSSQYVTLGNNFNFERTDSFSISFWAKWSSAATMTFIGKLADTTAFTGWQVACTSGGKVEFYLVNDYGSPNYLAVQTTSSSFNNGAWRHIVITYDGTSAPGGCRIYIDGSNQALTTVSNTLSASIITSANLWMGGRESASSHQYYTGSMDEVSIWNTVLSAADVTAMYNGKLPTNLLKMLSPSSTNLIGWWRMGDGDTAPTITDRSTGGHNGTMTNSPAITSDWPTSADYTVDTRNLLRNIKNALTDNTGWTDSTGAAATLSAPWVVVASSNGTVANTSDNWNTNADLVYNAPGSAHSWIVLRQTGLISGQNFELCLDLKSGNVYEVSAAVSFAGFDLSAPVTTARPTATDEYFWLSNQNWFNGSSAFNTVLNLQVSDDGYATRFWGLVVGAAKTFWMIERPKNTVTGWANPVVFAMASGTGILYTSFNDNAYMGFRAKNTNGQFYMTGEFYVDGCLGQRQTTVNSLTNTWQMTKIGLASISPTISGHHGWVSDMWWGNVTPATADTYPNSGTLKQFIQIDDVVVPWDRSTPVTT